MIAGKLQVNRKTLEAGDQARISGEEAIRFEGAAVNGKSAKSMQSVAEKAHFLFLDLP